MKVGDVIAGIYQKRLPDGKNVWFLHEGKINKIVQGVRGTKVYSKAFFPIDIEEIEENTKLLEEANGYIFVREVVLMNEITREKCERWIEYANDNPEKAALLLGKDD